MTDTPGTLEELEMDLHLARQGDYPGAAGVKRMADEIASLRARVEVMREALEAISVSGIHRDQKWFGMNAHDIARQALKDTPMQSEAERIAAGLSEREKWFLVEASPCKTGELWTPIAIRGLTEGGVVNELGLAVREVLMRPPVR